MKGPQILLENEGRLVTKMGGWFPGERVVMRGQDLHVDLADMDWMALYVYSITGRRLTPVQYQMLNAIWNCTSYPDPRLWNNRVSALAGTARSTGALAISAGIAVSEASVYGRRPDVRAFDFLIRTKQALDKGADLLECIKQELEKHRTIYGYGRPVVRGDERIQHLMKRVKDLGLESGEYVSLVFEIERLLLEGRWRLQMNLAALAAALVADMKFNIKEFYLYSIPCFVVGMLPCFIEAGEKAEGGFFPLDCDRIAYEGAPRRVWVNN
jgi:hypothetical protein